MFTSNDQGYTCIYTFTCDDCGAEQEVTAEDLKIASMALRDEGWKIKRDEDLKDWYHYCGECVRRKHDQDLKTISL